MFWKVAFSWETLVVGEVLLERRMLLVGAKSRMERARTLEISVQRTWPSRTRARERWKG